MSTTVDLYHDVDCRRLGVSVLESRGAVVVTCHSCPATLTVRLGAPSPDPDSCQHCGQRQPLTVERMCADCDGRERGQTLDPSKRLSTGGTQNE